MSKSGSVAHSLPSVDSSATAVACVAWWGEYKRLENIVHVACFCLLTSSASFSVMVRAATQSENKIR